MKVTILTSLPEFYSSVVGSSLLKRGLDNGSWSLDLVDIRRFGLGKNQKVDDYSYGGGGMVMRADVVSSCIQSCIDDPFGIPTSSNRLFVTMSPRGSVFNQKRAEFISQNINDLYILCNRFEGVDQRVIDCYSIQELSIGDYILLGGEVASVVILESVVRLLPNFLHNKLTTKEESFSDAMNGMLEYDHFTRPSKWNGIEVPQILLSGNHKQIKEWRFENSKYKTLSRR